MIIQRTTCFEDYKKITPDFIFNRFDLMSEDDDFITIKLIEKDTEKVIQIRFRQDTAELAIWLVPLTKFELEHILYFIHKNYPEIKTVFYKNGTIHYGKIKSHNHFRIVFPDTYDEMLQRVSGVSRKKLRKKIRLAQETYGKLSVHEYEHDIPDEIVEAFFQFKHETRGRVYQMSPQQYLKRYHVSHAYAFKLGDEIAAVRFACEQCAVVYGENFAYNPKFKDYSLGTCIFFYHLLRMVEKGHTELFFAGGDFEYKKHYDSIEEKLFDCEITLAEVDFTKFEPKPEPKPESKPEPKPEPDQPQPVPQKPALKQLLKKHFPNVCRKLNIK